MRPILKVTPKVGEKKVEHGVQRQGLEGFLGAFPCARVAFQVSMQEGVSFGTSFDMFKSSGEFY